MNLDEPETGDTGFDLDSSLNTIASGLGLSTPGHEPEPEETEVSDVAVDQVAAPEVVALDPPKSWSQDKHELWKTLPRDAQDYYNTREKQFLDGLEQYKGEATYAKQLRDVLTPYSPFLKSQGVSETDAVGYLLNAHYQLTNGSPEQRAAAYRQIGADLGLVQNEEEQQIDPAVKELRDQVRGLQSERTQEQQQKHAEAKAKADTETSAFASDPANAHFNEVAKDMVPFVQMGLSLKDAYDKAVWANPVTRQKELARLQTEDAAKLKEKAKTEGQAARKATSVNIRGQETRRAPTEPKGKMFDDMGDILATIKDRAH